MLLIKDVLKFLFIIFCLYQVTQCKSLVKKRLQDADYDAAGDYFEIIDSVQENSIDKDVSEIGSNAVNDDSEIFKQNLNDFEKIMNQILESSTIEATEDTTDVSKSVPQTTSSSSSIATVNPINAIEKTTTTHTPSNSELKSQSKESKSSEKSEEENDDGVTCSVSNTTEILSQFEVENTVLVIFKVNVTENEKELI